ncbi:MAG TPA: sigma-70 family RNA polymerase sigma factor [Candidatus Wallbacteria bacterium]|nr:sigma-70 family RNA polymerase sigma factor [Candidatus Wallbacteria bacterium]
MECNGINDIEVIEKVKEGNSAEFEKIITKYSKMIYSIAYRLLRDGEEARDLSQDVFLRAFRFISKYNPEFKLSTWLVRIAYNLYKDRFKTKKLHIVHQISHGDDEENKKYEERFIDNSPRPDEKVENKMKSEQIINIINRLPANYKMVITLYFWGDHSYEEIADIMEIPVGTVKSRLKRAKNYLLENYSRLLEKWK